MGGWIVWNRVVYFWATFWKQIRDTYPNVPPPLDIQLEGTTIQFKEMLALTINAVVFGPIIDNKYMLVLRTDNKGVETNIIKHRFKNYW